MKLAIQGPLDSCSRLNRVSRVHQDAPQQVPPAVGAEDLTFEVSHARCRHPHTGRRPSGSLCMPVAFHHTKHITLVSQIRGGHFEANKSQRDMP
jgi:hypothetical protein